MHRPENPAKCELCGGAAVSESVAGLLARMDEMADDDSGLLDGEVQTIREAITALHAATDRAEKAEAELTRIGNVPWRDKHALATAGNIEAHLRRKLREAESRLATAIERVKQLPRYRPEIGWSQWSQYKFGMGSEYPYAEESDEGNFIDRAAVLSILTGEPRP